MTPKDQPGPFQNLDVLRDSRKRHLEAMENTGTCDTLNREQRQLSAHRYADRARPVSGTATHWSA
jgi:hypothetical protein